MRLLLLTYLLAFLSSASFGQNKDVWTIFWNKDTTLFGFKDKSGNVKIKPRFVRGLGMANRFEHIVAVTEEVNGRYKSYYLTKTGKIVGRDSLHIFDNTLDCESEGFIRFHDRKTDKMGMFNRNGEIAIPAQYNYLTEVRNGMIIALAGAEKKCMRIDKHSDHSNCEHFRWSGGKQLLIDTANHVLIDSFKYENNLNFFSLQKSDRPSQDTIRHNYLAADGQYYSFVNPEKEFKQWLNLHLLNNFTKENLEKASFQEITYWKEPNGWTVVSKKDFIDRNFELIKAKLLELKSANCDYIITDGGLCSSPPESEEYDDYFNDCGGPIDGIYPIKDIIITHKDEEGFTQDHFDFLKTKEGYKLISITLRKGKLR